MIYLVMDDRKLLILEPENLRHLRDGGLVVAPDKSVALALTPDLPWFQEQVLKIGAENLQAENITRLLKEGIKRPDAGGDRPPHPTWDAMKKGGTA